MSSVNDHSARAEYGVLPPRMRLVVFAVSIFGSFGPPAQAFLTDLSRRSGGSVPAALLPQATWAVPRLAPFVRMAVSHAVRRGLAESVVRYWRRYPSAADVPRAPAPPPPPPPPPPPFVAALAALGVPPIDPGLFHAPVAVVPGDPWPPLVVD